MYSTSRKLTLSKKLDSRERSLAQLGFGNIIRFGIFDCKFPRSGNETPSSSSAGRRASLSIDKFKQLTASPSTTSNASNSGELSPRSAYTSGEFKERVGSSEYSSSDWKKQFILLCEWCGSGRIYIFDPNTWTLNYRIHLRSVTHITIDIREPTVINFKDNSGLRWQLRPDCLESADDRNIFKYWLLELSRNCNSQATTERLIYKGQLSKRGKVNTAFKKRWFYLIADNYNNFTVRLIADDLWSQC